MEKDKDIEILFAEQTADEQPKTELLMPAMNELRAKNARKKARKQRLFKLAFGFSAAAVVLVVSLGILLPRLFGSGKNSASPPSAPNYYTAAEVTMTERISETVKNSLPLITHINGDSVLSESAEEYAFSDGSAAYAVVKYRRRGRYGIEDVTLTVEFSDDVYEGNKEFYALISGDFNCVTSRENGEYIGKCAAVKNGIRFYIDIMCANSIEIEYYEKIF